MENPRLIQLSYSPWSERARWALDHHRIPYRIVEHAPFIGELRLRRMLGKRSGRATVPALIDGSEVITESWDIARYADAHGAAEKLIPSDIEDKIRTWVSIADRCSSHGRTLVVAGLLASPAALDESLPFPVPEPLRAVMRPVTRFGLRWFAKKYDVDPAAVTAAEAKVREGLLELRPGLEKDGTYFLGAFSYADIAVATLIQGISPVGNGFIRLGPATRRAWTVPRLAEEFADLVRWRDTLYARHRPQAATVAKSS